MKVMDIRKGGSKQKREEMLKQQAGGAGGEAFNYSLAGQIVGLLLAGLAIVVYQRSGGNGSEKKRKAPKGAKKASKNN
jgi:hypothetical protein